MRLLGTVTSLPRWKINLWTIVIAELLMLTAFNGASVLIPYYVQQVGVTDLREVGMWTGAFQSAGGITFALFTPIWGALGDRYGRKLMLVRAMAATVCVLIVMGLIRTPMQLLVLRFVQGCFTGTPAAATALLATGSPRHSLAYALGLLQTALFVGGSLGPMFGGYVGDLWGYRSTFFASAGIGLAALIITLFLVREGTPETGARGAAKREGTLRAFRALLGSRELLFLIGLSMLISLGYSIVGPVVPLCIQELLPHSDRIASAAGTITGASALTAAVSALVVGRLSDRIGHRRALIGCALGTALLYLPQALARSAVGLGVWQGLQGLFRGGISPNVSASIADMASESRTGAALGLSSSASTLGYAVGPMLGAGLMAAASVRLVFVAAGALFGIVALGAYAVGSAPAAGGQRPQDAPNAV